MHLRLTTLVLLCSASVSAQSLVDPQPFEHIVGARETGFPFGYPNRDVVRYQEVHDGLIDLAGPIQGVAFRRSPRNGATTGAIRATVSLSLSTSPRTAATISSQFATNIGPDRTVLLDRVAIDFPATLPPTAGEPAAFEFALPGMQAFAYPGTGPLCVDLTVHGHDGRDAFTFDLFQAEQPHVVTLGQSCGGTSLSTVLNGTTVHHIASGLPAGAPTIFAAGIDLAQMNGIPLPWDLELLGAPGCLVVQAPEVNLLDFADPQGGYELEYPVTSLPPGVWYSCQVAAVQPGLNPLGLVLTEGSLVVPQSGRFAGRVWSEDLTATSGQAQPVFALITEIL